MPVVTTETDEVPVVKTFEVPSGDTLPVPETPVVEIPETPGSELPKTGDSSLPLYAFLASAFGLVLLISSGFIGKRNADETVNKKQVSCYPQMCCGPRKPKKIQKERERKSYAFFRNKECVVPFWAPAPESHKDCFSPHPSGWGLFVSEKSINNKK